MKLTHKSWDSEDDLVAGDDDAPMSSKFHMAEENQLPTFMSKP